MCTVICTRPATYPVLSHWAHFIVHRFIGVYMYVFVFFFIPYYCNTVVLAWWEWSLVLRTLSSSSALTLLVGSFDLWKPVPNMTYNVFGRMLSLTQLKLRHTGTVFLRKEVKWLYGFDPKCGIAYCAHFEPWQVHTGGQFYQTFRTMESLG